MAFRVAVVAFILTTYFLRTHSKVYHRCELAYELRDIHEIPEHQLATWICIANYESHFNTSAHNPGSGDHGLFQISELYWCSPPGVGFACGLPCAAFKDDDIEDDVICARRIYREHQRLSGDGFTAWVVYNLYCRNQAHVNSFIEGCFDQENLIKYPYNKYDYQYQAMNLPTVMVPMTTVPELPSSMAQSQSTSPAINFTTEESTPKSTTPTKQEQKIVSTESPILTTVTSAKPTKPKQSPRPTTAKLLPSSVSPTPKPVVSTPFSKLTTAKSPSSAVKSSPTPKPVVSTPLSKLTHKPPTPTAKPLPPPISPTIKPPIVVSSPSTPKPVASTPKPPRPTKLRHSSNLPTLKPLQRKPTTKQRVTPRPTLRLSSLYPVKTTTLKPIFTTRYRSSSPVTSITRGPRIRLTTPRRINAYDATRPFFAHTTSKPTLFTLSSSKMNSAVSSLSVSVVTPTATYRNNDNIKPVLLKPRETKIAKYKPFEFNKNEVVYAVVNKPDYSFAISSNGFKFVRTVR